MASGDSSAIIERHSPAIGVARSCAEPASARSSRCCWGSRSWPVSRRPPWPGRTGPTRATGTGPTTTSSARPSGCSTGVRRPGLTWTWPFGRAMTRIRSSAGGRARLHGEGLRSRRGRPDRRELPPGVYRSRRGRRRDRVDRVRLAGPLLRRHPAAVSHQPRRGRSEGLAPSLRDAGRPDDADGGHVAGLDHGRPDPDRADRRADDGHRRGGLLAQVLPGALPAVPCGRDRPDAAGHGDHGRAPQARLIRPGGRAVFDRPGRRPGSRWPPRSRPA